MVRAKILFLADRHIEASEEIVAAWKLDAGRVVSLQECRKRFIEAYRSIVAPSCEQKLVFAEMSWSEAGAVMGGDDPTQALSHASTAAQVYESVERDLLATAPNSNVRSQEETKRLSALSEEVLDRSARRLVEFRDQAFAQWVLSRARTQHSEAA